MKTQRVTQRGVSSVEYLLGLTVLFFALFAPIPDRGGKSIADVLADAIKSEFSGYSFAISLPKLPTS